MKDRKKRHLVDVLKNLGPQPELADAIEKESKRMRKAKMRNFKI
jgi:predicted CopG family antitoxin